jgi:ferric-dicitrate binding protein FerR (iron transport regulator)
MRSVIAAFVVLAVSGLCHSQKAAGKVTRAVAPATVTSGTKTTEAEPDETLKWNDTLKTDQNGRLRAVLSDGSILTLTSNAVMRVVSHDKETGKTELELKYGYVRASVVGAVGGATAAPFEIRTSTAVCGVLGTQFEIQTDDTATQVHVHEGQVHFTNSKTGQRMNLLQGQTAHLVHRSGAMRQGLFPKFAAQTRKRWLAEREEIQGERLERNQHRQERAREIRQRQAAESKAKAKKKRPEPKDPKGKK